MSSLLNLQNKFQHYLLHGRADFKKSIVSTEKVLAETRLSIYSNAYRSRLMEALANNYPILHIYLGDHFFEKIAHNYIDRHPSHYRSIRWFGDQLANFLNDHPECKTFPHLAELAQFEWTMTLVFDAADSTLLQIEDIAKIPPESWETMRLYAHPSVHRINLSWNVVQIWQAVSDGDTPDGPQLVTSSIPWVLWRRDFINQFYSLTEAQSFAIDAILQKLTFGEIGEGLCQWFDEQEAGIQAASLLKEWTQSGLLTNVMF